MIKKLSYIKSEKVIPYENLALEEYLMNHCEEEEVILYLWQNKNTVVIGKNQSIQSECNLAAMKEDDIKPVRRLSGGGAVFHDMGNLNFTFLVRKKNYDVKKQLAVIIKAVSYFGINAVQSGRNDCLVDGKKFSGNAFLKSGDYCYHHGTLLIDTDGEKMKKYLNPPKIKLESKGVKSVKSRVVNLNTLNPELTVDSICGALEKAFAEVYGLEVQPFEESRIDHEAVRAGVVRFEDPEWIMGNSVPYSLELEDKFDWGHMTVQLDIKNAQIKNLNVYSDSMNPSLTDEIKKQLAGCPFDAENVSQRLDNFADAKIGELAVPLDSDQTEETQKEMAAKISEDLKGLLCQYFAENH